MKRKRGKNSLKTTAFAGAMSFMVMAVPTVSAEAAISMVESQNYKSWSETEIYTTGDKVVYNKKVYEAKWWTQGNLPDVKVEKEWETPWKYICESTGEGIETPVPDDNQGVGQGIEWGQHVFAPYVDATSWPPAKLSEISQQTGCKFFNLGFIVSKDKKASWGTYYDAEKGPLNDEIKKLRDIGGDVMVSFGGAANTPLHVDITDTKALKDEYRRFVDIYGLTKIDFDIEGAAVADKAATERNTDALLMLKEEMKKENKKLDIWFTLPVLPSGLTPDGLYVIEDAIKKGLEFEGVNVMTMDFGSWAAPNPEGNMGQYSIDAITALHDQVSDLYKKYDVNKSDEDIWAMIGATPMIGVNDVKTEVFKQSDADKLLNFAKEKKIGYVGFWSINRDQGGTLGECSSKHTGIDSKQYEFTSIMNKYMEINTKK